MKLIAGPCVIESKQVLKQTIEHLLETTHNMTDIDFYFKSSYKKDNRTIENSFQSIGSIEAIYLLREIAKEYSVKVCTDFHSVEDLKQFAQDVDVIQIPAFLAKQLSLLREAASSTKKMGKKLFIKKPQFMSPDDVTNIFQLTNKFGLSDQDVFVADRGTMLGYDRYFMDPRHIEIMKSGQHVGENHTILVDITHPQKNYFKTVPSHILAWRLGLSAMAAGADGIFLETHPNCSEALCDADTMMPLDYSRKAIKEFYELHQRMKNVVW